MALIGRLLRALGLGRERAAPTREEASIRHDAAPEAAPDAAPAVTRASALRAALIPLRQRLWRHAFGLDGPPPALSATDRRIVEMAVETISAERLSERWFPRRPLLMPKLQAAVNDPDAPATKLAGIIGQDPVLAGNVLRLANSVHYRLTTEPVETIQRAIVVCGTDGLHSLAATSLMQPIFRGGTEAHMRFPAILWEQCTRTAIAGDVFARAVHPSERQIAQLLALIAALGPLAAYRIVQEIYRERQGLAPSSAAFLHILEVHSPGLAVRIAKQWQSPPRLVAALIGCAAPAGETVLHEVAEGLEPLLEVLWAGELLGTLSVLGTEGLVAVDEARRVAAQAGIPDRVIAEVAGRLGSAP